MKIMIKANSKDHLNDNHLINGKDLDKVNDNENLKNYDKDDKKIKEINIKKFEFLDLFLPTNMLGS